MARSATEQMRRRFVDTCVQYDSILIYGISTEFRVGCSAQLAKSKNVVVTDLIVNAITRLGAINVFFLQSPMDSGQGHPFMRGSTSDYRWCGGLALSQSTRGMENRATGKPRGEGR